jgi:hypothetical protein
MSIGPGTVHLQHERYLDSVQRYEEPRDAIYTDIFRDITSWKEMGDQIIVGIDANEDVRHGDTAATFQSLGMKEAILAAHHHRSPPRNLQHEPTKGTY